MWAYEGTDLSKFPPKGKLVDSKACLDFLAREYFLDYNAADALPPRLGVLAERSSVVFEGYFRMHHGVLRARRC